MNARTIAPRKTGRKKTESRFQRLWAEAEALEKDNLELEAQLDTIVKRIDSEVFVAERKLGEVLYEAVNRQLDFAQKKSLLKWQRSELSEWIDENLSELVAMGMVDQTLRDKLATLRASELGADIDQDSPLSPAEQLDQFLKDEADEFRKLMEMDEGLSDEEESEQADLFDIDLDDDEDLSDDEVAELLRKVREEFEGRQHSTDAGPPRSQHKDISDAVFKRLFRQTATALHPDKETDELRRQEKHELMSQLLKARKEYDLITILRLHTKHAAVESTLNIADQQELEEILVQYLNQQQQRMDNIVQKSPMHQMAFAEFYDKRPAIVTRRIKAHLKKIEERKAGILFFTTQVKTLKALKEILSERYDASMWHRDNW